MYAIFNNGGKHGNWDCDCVGFVTVIPETDNIAGVIDQLQKLHGDPACRLSKEYTGDDIIEQIDEDGFEHISYYFMGEVLSAWHYAAGDDSIGDVGDFWFVVKL